MCVSSYCDAIVIHICYNNTIASIQLTNAFYCKARQQGTTRAARCHINMFLVNYTGMLLSTHGSCDIAVFIITILLTNQYNSSVYNLIICFSFYPENWVSYQNTIRYRVYTLYRRIGNGHQILMHTFASQFFLLAIRKMVVSFVVHEIFSSKIISRLAL